MMSASHIEIGPPLQRWPMTRSSGRGGLVRETLRRARDIPARLAVGVLAFALVMVAELALAVLLFGQSPAQHVAAYRHFAGVAGLAAQLAYALFPALRRGEIDALG
jgi:hypothetical protein